VRALDEEQLADPSTDTAEYDVTGIVATLVGADQVTSMAPPTSAADTFEGTPGTDPEAGGRYRSLFVDPVPGSATLSTLARSRMSAAIRDAALVAFSD
jgi:hypothetical protein